MRPTRATISPTIELLESRDNPAPFSFGGFTFDDANTPDGVGFLPLGTYDKAVVTSLPTTQTGAVAFPEPPATGFDTNQTLGTRLFAGTGARALNLPSGNNGTANRSGITLGYNPGVAIPNGAGDDILIYESGNRRASDGFSDPEPMMIQARIASTGQYTRWYYEPAENFGFYTGSNTIGAFATAFDLSDLGLAPGELVDSFRLVNMTAADRMVLPSGKGFVLPEDNGATSMTLPNPGPLSSQPVYDAASLDPDPLYFAALQGVTTTGTNVAVTQTLAPSPNLTAGGPATLTVTVTNAGSITASSVPFAVTLPGQVTGATFTSSAAGGATGNSATGTGAPSNSLTLPAGASVTYTITTTVRPTATGTATFTSAIGAPAAPVFDSNSADNTATTDALVVTNGDLAVTISNPALTAGQGVTYTVTAQNSGPSTITGAPLAVSLPAVLDGVTFTSVTTGGATGNTSPGTGAPSDSLTLPAGASVTYTITGTVRAGSSGTATASVSIAAPAGVTDPNLANNQASVTSTIAAGPPQGNRPPVATPDSAVAFVGISNAPITIAVLANDSDPDNDPLTVSLVSQPTLGVAVVNADGTIGYTPNGTSGTDVFTYQIADGRGGTATATVTVNNVRVDGPVGPGGPGGNLPPIAAPDFGNTAFNTPVTVRVLANDTDPNGDPLTVLVAGDPSNGRVVVNADGTITYTPNAGFSGEDAYTYSVTDGKGGVGTASVRIIVAAGIPVVPPVVPPINPAARPAAYAIGSGLGQKSRAVLYNPDGTARLSFQPFETDFTGGVRVATGDVTGDGVPDMIVVPALGGGPRVEVYDGVTGALLFNQFLYEPEARSGLFVAVGDVTGDGRADIILSPGIGGGPRIRVFDFANGTIVGNFFAYDGTFRGGATVAVGDLDGDGINEIITAPGAGLPQLIRSFNLDGTQRGGEFVVDPGNLSAVSIASGDFAGGPASEIAVGSAPGGGQGLVRTYTPTGTQIGQFQPYEDAFTGGVRVGTYTPINGRSRIVTVAGLGGGPRVSDFAADGTGLRLNQFQLADDDRGGLYVG